MTTHSSDDQNLLMRIDGIMQELLELRRIVLSQSVAPVVGETLAQQMYGALGQGSSDEWDRDIDWQRFDE